MTKSRRAQVRGRVSTKAFIVALACGASALGGSTACTSTPRVETVGGSVKNVVVTKSGQALTVDGAVASFQAINGTYGAGCTTRSGEWSTAIGNFSGALAHPTLSVVKNDATCVLTLTSLMINDRTYAPGETLALSSMFASSALSFATTGAPFFANAKITPDDFSSDFTFDLFVSDDVSTVAGSATADFAAVGASTNVALNPAPDYAIDSSGVQMTSDANAVLQSLSGNLVMSQGQVAGAAYVIYTGPLDTSNNAAVNAAYQAGTEIAISEASFDVAAADMGLVVGTTVLPQTRYIIVRNTTNAVTTYEAIPVTFNQAVAPPVESASTCAHSVCGTGDALDPTCDPCAAQVCAGDSFCCDILWDSSCATEASACNATCN